MVLFSFYLLGYTLQKKILGSSLSDNKLGLIWAKLGQTNYSTTVQHPNQINLPLKVHFNHQLTQDNPSGSPNFSLYYLKWDLTLLTLLKEYYPYSQTDLRGACEIKDVTKKEKVQKGGKG